MDDQHSPDSSQTQPTEAEPQPIISDTHPEAEAVQHRHHITHHHVVHHDAEAAPVPAIPSASNAPIKRPGQVDASDNIDAIAPPSQPNPKKAAISFLSGMVALLVLGAVWFQANQGVYTLGGQPNKVASRVTPTPKSNQSQTLGAETSSPKLTLNLNLQPLSKGHYQAWLTQGDTTQSLGAFNTTTAGPLTNLDGSSFNPSVTLKQDQPAKIFVTVEAGDTVVQAPSQTVILSGDLQGNKASLKFTALDLSQASGSFILATPTDNDNGDEKSGVWFAHAENGKLTSPSLNLPDAPTGWKYEAQVVYKGVAVEIGRFSKANQADEFSKFSGTDNQPPSVPGEDFLQHSPSVLGVDFPTDLTTGEWTVLISLEPDQNGTDPTGNDTFFLKPLSAKIAQGSDDHKDYPLTLDLSSFPSGSAELK